MEVSRHLRGLLTHWLDGNSENRADKPVISVAMNIWHTFCVEHIVVCFWRTRSAKIVSVGVTMSS